MKLVIFDGNSIINRAFYGIRLLSNREGVYTNAIYGFLNIYLKFLEELKPDCVCVAFDRREPTFRHERYEGYKAQRTGMPEELAMQLPLLKEVLSAMRVRQLELPRYEADDIIGTVARMCAEQEVECHIVTGDKDDLQLIGPLVKVQLITTRMGQTTTTVMDEESFREKYHLPPSGMIDLKALMGDSSDNIPGVAGIGEKTAQRLLEKYGTVEALYEALEQSDEKPGVKKKLLEGREMAYLSYELATIDTHVPLEFRLEEAALQSYDQGALRPLLEKLELKQLITRMCSEPAEPEPAPCGVQADWEPLERPEQLAKWACVCAARYDGGWGFSDGNEVRLLAREREDYSPLLAQVCKLEGPWYVHDWKSLLVELQQLGIEPPSCTFDIFVGAYLADPSRSSYELAELNRLYLGVDIPLDKKTGRDEAYIAAGLRGIPRLADRLMQEVEDNGQHQLYYEVEQPLCEVLADMENRGFAVNASMLEQFGQQLDGGIEAVRQQVYELAGEEFNIHSPKQLGVILFEKLGLPVIKKTKTGYSTDIDVMNKLVRYHPIAEAIVQYRQLTKLKSTYVDGLLAVLGPDGRIHSSFNQTITQTGRLSSTEPNLQNIPVRLEMGREVRKVFVPEEGCVLLDADYSQIELRVLAHIAQDETMIDAFARGVDIHALTASTAFGVPLQEVTPQMRSSAKAVNFGIVYGIGDFSLAEDLHISRKEAKHYIDSYLSTYHGVREYMQQVVEQAKQDGYVTTLFGRRRYIPELQSKNHNIREFGKRCAMNTPIQGTAADIIKIAMVEVYRELKARGLRSYLVLQVHDELIINTWREELEEVQAILRDKMEHACQLRVALEVDMHTGDSWFSAKG
ncbi:MAG: DNA polymerase I [Eubacteriales bacterium]|jgi:DNA polymerase-1